MIADPLRRRYGHGAALVPLATVRHKPSNPARWRFEFDVWRRSESFAAGRRRFTTGAIVSLVVASLATLFVHRDREASDITIVAFEVAQAEPLPEPPPEPLPLPEPEPLIAPEPLPPPPVAKPVPPPPAKRIVRRPEPEPEPRRAPKPRAKPRPRVTAALPAPVSAPAPDPRPDQIVRTHRDRTSQPRPKARPLVAVGAVRAPEINDAPVPERERVQVARVRDARRPTHTAVPIDVLSAPSQPAPSRAPAPQRAIRPTARPTRRKTRTPARGIALPASAGPELSPATENSAPGRVERVTRKREEARRPTARLDAAAVKPREISKALAVQTRTSRPVVAVSSRRDDTKEHLEGVPLGSLAACLTDLDEELLKTRVLAEVGARRECTGPAGRYRFVETKNLNAFLMYIERDASRGEADRCTELAFALRCLSD